MIVANLWFIKCTNGLFYYGLDYCAAARAEIRYVVVRSSDMAKIASQALPHTEIVVAGSLRFLGLIAEAKRQGDFLFTPSSHPLPFIGNQMVVVHDVYPFVGRHGMALRLLFDIAAKSGRAFVGYINHAEAEKYLRGRNLRSERLVYAPNKVPSAQVRGQDTTVRMPERIQFGLFGTDSPKKNYDKLFAAISSSNHEGRVHPVIYGHRNAYIEHLIGRFPHLGIEVVASDSCSPDAFISRMDLIASAADGEGFGRPIATALLSGKPCFLVDGPVFREFYDGAAQFFGSVELLGAALAELGPGMLLARPDFAGDSLARAFESAAQWLIGQSAAGKRGPARA